MKSTPALGGENAQLLGSLLLAPYDFVPEHFQKCAGQLLPIDRNTNQLFALIGNKFGGNGLTEFALPDLKGHEPIEGLSYFIATRGIFPSPKGLGPDIPGVHELLGQLLLVAYLPQHTPPRFWHICDGKLLEINGENSALFALIQNKFGGDPRKKTFALPDLRGHEPAKGLTYVIAMRGRFPRAG
jgi:microcystin-dependent protein